MNITVFGASGGIGSQVVAFAAGRGHQVRAVYRTAPAKPLQAQAEIILAPDIFGDGVAARAVAGADIVVCAVGPNFAERHKPRTALTSPPDLHQRLARAVITAMRTAAPRARLITVSTASMGPADDLMSAAPRMLLRFMRTVLVPNLGRVGRDLRATEAELAASGLDWYALRPVKLTDGPLTRNVRADQRFTMKTVSRADVAWHIVMLAEDPAPGPLHTPVITTAASREPRGTDLQEPAVPAAGVRGRLGPEASGPAGRSLDSDG